MSNACLYAILRHEGVDRPHFDLMFQIKPGGKLATWRAEVWRPTGPIAVERIGDHRQAYLTFEGKLSGNRGSVRRVEQGICEIEIQAEGWWKVWLKPAPKDDELILRMEDSRCVPIKGPHGD